PAPAPHRQAGLPQTRPSGQLVIQVQGFRADVKACGMGGGTDRQDSSVKPASRSQAASSLSAKTQPCGVVRAMFNANNAENAGRVWEASVIRSRTQTRPPGRSAA